MATRKNGESFIEKNPKSTIDSVARQILENNGPNAVNLRDFGIEPTARNKMRATLRAVEIKVDDMLVANIIQESRLNRWFNRP